MMYLLLMYDISSDRIRTKVASICEDYGLDRTQYSAFYGQLSRNRQEELMHQLTYTLGKGEGRIQLVPVSPQDWARRIEVNQYG